jgi:hypothetical protein
MATATFTTPTDLTPNASKVTLAENYLNFHTGGVNWTQQYLPDLYEQEVERYGNRSVSGFLRMVGAEMPMTSDQVIWSEQARLHLSYKGAALAADSSNTNVITIASSGTHAVRVGQTVAVGDETTGVVVKGYVTAVAADNTTLTVAAYANATGLVAAGLNASNTVSLFVYGSEFAKGTDAIDGSVEPNFQSFSNRPLILKDKFEVSGSDASQIGWVEVTGEAGQTGYLWYMKAEGDTRTRFEDYCETSLIEAEKKVATHAELDPLNIEGSEGMFAAITARGNVATNVFDTAADTIADFDLVLKELDKQGAIEENMLFLNRDAALTLDDALGAINSNYNGGTSFGVFENSEDMALNLGFSGFRRGSYDFYKTDWKYLNNQATRGLFSDIKGVLIPAGTSSVYDQMLGKNIRRPFLHVRYRASEADDRRMKSWVTGSVGGAATEGFDRMQVHFLSEKCLITQAANNFVLFK